MTDFPSDAEIRLALLESQAARRREINRNAQRRRRAKRTEDEKQAESEEHAEYMRQLRATRDAEAKAKWNAYMREYRAKKKAEKTGSFEI